MFTRYLSMYDATMAAPENKFGGLTEFVFGVLLELNAEEHSASLAQVGSLFRSFVCLLDLLALSGGTVQSQIYDHAIKIWDKLPDELQEVRRRYFLVRVCFFLMWCFCTALQDEGLQRQHPVDFIQLSDLRAARRHGFAEEAVAAARPPDGTQLNARISIGLIRRNCCVTHWPAAGCSDCTFVR